MLPQSAVGGWVTRPRKNSPAVARIFAAADGEHEVAHEGCVGGEAHHGDGQAELARLVL
jgi:hypothetical protein